MNSSKHKETYSNTQEYREQKKQMYGSRFPTFHRFQSFSHGASFWEALRLINENVWSIQKVFQ